jgi:hypothetical protein
MIKCANFLPVVLTWFRLSAVASLRLGAMSIHETFPSRLWNWFKLSWSLSFAWELLKLLFGQMNSNCWQALLETLFAQQNILCIFF